ncbi:MAG: hypothetical protein JWO53_1309 [Chlamydiia bacterium]|nr:hypothetical protein [Chlamydiia bacterium]
MDAIVGNRTYSYDSFVSCVSFSDQPDQEILPEVLPEPEPAGINNSQRTDSLETIIDHPRLEDREIILKRERRQIKLLRNITKYFTPFSQQTKNISLKDVIKRAEKFVDTNLKDSLVDSEKRRKFIISVSCIAIQSMDSRYTKNIPLDYLEKVPGEVDQYLDGSCCTSPPCTIL